MSEQYKLNKVQASAIAVQAFKAGVPSELVPEVVRAANEAYRFGYADARMDNPRNDAPFELDYDMLERMAMDDVVADGLLRKLNMGN